MLNICLSGLLLLRERKNFTYIRDSFNPSMLHYQTLALDQFQLIGICVRTTNQNNQSAQDIGNLFNRFIQHNLIEKIPNKLDDDLYCVYTDYESDYTGPYNVILGCKVRSFENLPSDFVGKTIPKATYQRYTAMGQLPDCVAETWNKLWQSTIDRRYTADFDVYSLKSNNPNHAEVDIYLSVN